MIIARVFPRRTAMTPTDELAFVDCPPPMLILPEIDEVHVSVAFSWDMPRAEQLAEQWRAVGVPIKVGGRAYRDPGGDFLPGMYIKKGAVITSRGCDNCCWYCEAWQIEGPIRELPIADGWNILDNNLLGCSEQHIRAVFEMLKRQPERPIFTGGLEAKLLRPWHVDLLREVRAQRMYFAYDTPDDYEPLVEAGKLLRAGGFAPHVSHRGACYVLIGYRGDTIPAAEMRLYSVINAGFVPYAMLYRDEHGGTDLTWRRFQREWVRPEIVASKMREVTPLWMEA